ncbi:MAG: sigma-70 family RNA polymerase sigma factor [Planctomycetaceae bacterium]|nr:sigma-70 family RNA polymerase sigma factor [Planctomycetaceae bacterium]
MASTPDPRPDAAELLAEAGFLRRLASELVTLPHDADDLVQETYVRALEHAPQRSTSLRGWLSVVARNLALNASRSRSRRDEHERRAARPEALDAGELALERLEQQKRLFELVLSLPEEQRTVLYLRYYEGLTPTEIAQRVGAPLKTVKTRQTRALAALRERLDARDGGDGKSWRLALAPLVPLSTAPTTGSLIATLFGGLVMKKAFVVAALLLLALVSWFGFRRLTTARPDSSIAASFEEPARAEPPRPATPLSAETLAQREELAAGHAHASETPTVGRAEITLLWSDGTPAAGIGATMDLARARGTPAQRARAVTDESGLLVLDVLALGRNRLTVDLRETFWLEMPENEVLRKTITLERGEQVHGRVLDERGQPLGGAGIVLELRQIWTSEIAVATRTDAAGEFRLRDISLDSEIGARAPGFLPSPHVQVGDLGAQSSVRQAEFRLKRGSGKLAGRVLKPDGTPCAGAHVLAGPDGGHNVPSPFGGDARAPSPMKTTSAADGRFEIADALPTGTQPVHCFAPGFARWSGKVTIAEATEDLVIQLEAAARIEGRVLDASGAPVAGASIVQSVEQQGGWFVNDKFPAPRDTTDDDGWFVLEWVAPGTREINASHPKRADLGRARANVACRAGETTRCEVRLDPGQLISGKIVDELGRPLAGWYVGSRPSDMLNQWYPRSAFADAEGRFVLANLGPGSHDLSVRTPQLSAPRLVVPKVAPGSTGLELVVPDSSSESELTGRIVASSPDLLVGIELTLWLVGQNEGHFLDYDAESGQFRGSAFPGTYKLDVTRHGANVVETSQFELRPGERTDLGDIALAPSGSLDLELIGLAQEDLGRLHLFLRRPDARDIALHNENGKATVPALLAGRWELRLGEPELELSSSVIEVQPGAPTRVQVEVRPKRR